MALGGGGDAAELFFDEAALRFACEVSGGSCGYVKSRIRGFRSGNDVELFEHRS